MAKVSLSTIKNWFKTGLKPTQAQFWDTWDSFRHKDDAVPAVEVSGLDALLAGKAEATHTTDPNAHPDVVAILRDEMTRSGLASQLVEIVIPVEEVVDPASWSIIEKLNAWLTAPLVIQQSSLIYVRYWHSELSDGDAATIRTWAVFLLEPGTYGPGGQPIPNVKVINDLSFGAELEMNTRRVKLSTTPVLTQASGSSIATQDQFNKRVDELLGFEKKTAFFPYGLKLAATDQVDIPSLEFFSIANVHEFKGSANVVLPTVSPSTFKNVIQWDSNNNDGNADLKYSVVVGYSTDSDGHKISIILQETISNVSFRQWSFNPILTNKSFGSLDFSYWIRVEDILTNHFKAEIISNGIRFTIDTLSGSVLNLGDSLLEFFPINQPWTVSNFPILNRINFQANFPDAVEIYKMEFATSDNGLGYNNLNTIWDEEKLLLDYSGSKIGKNRLFTLKNASNIIPESFFIKKKISGRVNFIDDDGMAKPLELVTGVFERKFNNFPLQSIIVEDMLDRAIRIDNIIEPGLIKTKFMAKTMKKLDENYKIDERLTGLFLPEINSVRTVVPPTLVSVLVNVVNPESGYFTLSRETVKYRHRESLLIEEIPLGNVAVDYLNGFPELIVEPQRTNLVKNSEPTAVENTDTGVTYEAINNPFGFESWAKIVPNQTSAQLRYAGTNAVAGTVKNTYFFNRHGNLLLNVSGTALNYEFILAVGGVPSTNLKDYKIRLKKINEQFHVVSSQRALSVSSAVNGIWLNQTLSNFHPIIFSGLMTEIVPSFNLFHGSYIRTIGVAKTVDADIYTINNLIANGLISATEGTIIERGSNQEVRTVWIGGNKLKFIDNALISTIVELPNDNTFTLDTSSYRLSEILIYNKAILP